MDSIKFGKGNISQSKNIRFSLEDSETPRFRTAEALNPRSSCETYLMEKKGSNLAISSSG